jgi:hypothetical protein
MRKFGVIHYKGITTVQEVECVEAFCYSWEVRGGEKKYNILKPTELKDQIWMGWALVDTEGDAFAKANLELRSEHERRAEKSHTVFDEHGFVIAVAAIKVNKL